MTETFKLVGDTKIRYDWYQTETHVSILILQKNINGDSLKVESTENTVSVSLPEVDAPIIFDLRYEVQSSEMQIKVSLSKVEIKLPKVDGRRWETLEVDPEKVSKKEPKNWDKLVKEVNVDDEDPMNELFRKIYNEGSDEVKKAMNKSFTESGGTVLSTNWNEVGAEKVDIKPPDGMEWKKWES